MKIVVLDGYGLNPGDLSWEPLQALGETQIYDYTSREETVARAKDAAIVITNKTVLDEPILSQLSNTKYIGALSTGYDIVDVDYAKAHGIVVTNIPSYCPDAVAQSVFALILELCSKVGLHNRAVKEGQWCRSEQFCFWNAPLVELCGKTMGIYGMGRIGQKVAAIAQAFQMRVIAYSRTVKELKGIDWVTEEGLFRESDILSLHCPMTKETQGIINQRTLSLMKPSAILINTARGKLICEQDLADALNTEKLGGAGLDVLAVEPARPDNPLLTARNIVITPHIAWAVYEARQRLMDIATENVKCFLEGAPQNQV